MKKSKIRKSHISASKAGQVGNRPRPNDAIFVKKLIKAENLAGRYGNTLRNLAKS